MTVGKLVLYIYCSVFYADFRVHLNYISSFNTITEIRLLKKNKVARKCAIMVISYSYHQIVISVVYESIKKQFWVEIHGFMSLNLCVFWHIFYELYQ